MSVKSEPSSLTPFKYLYILGLLLALSPGIIIYIYINSWYKRSSLFAPIFSDDEGEKSVKLPPWRSSRTSRLREFILFLPSCTPEKGILILIHLNIAQSHLNKKCFWNNRRVNMWFPNFAFLQQLLKWKVWLYSCFENVFNLSVKYFSTWAVKNAFISNCFQEKLKLNVVKFNEST